MRRTWQLLVDQQTVAGRLVTTLAVVVVASVVGWAVGGATSRRFADRYARYYARKASRYAVGILAAIVLAIVWRPFAGRFGVVLGLMAAGIAFADSAVFEFIWEELAVPVPHDADWRQVENILAEEAARVSATEGADVAIDEMTRRYPMARADVEPRVFARATDDWIELSARFVDQSDPPGG
jgi:hypothetical protein